MTGAGKGSPAGRTKLSSVVTLTEDSDVTIIGYQVQADVGGGLAQLGGAIVEKTLEEACDRVLSEIRSAAERR